MKWNKSDWIFVLILLIIYIFAATIQPGTSIYNWISDIASSWRSLSQNQPFAILITLLSCSIGNTTLFIGFIPFPIIVFDIAKYYEPWWLLGIIGGIGAGIGEFSTYIIGWFVGSAKNKNIQEFNARFIPIKEKMEQNPKLIPTMTFLFAATPLPDDIIMVPFGIMKYPLWKGLLPCILGKIVMITIFTAIGNAVGENTEALNLLIDEYPILFFLHLFVPSTEINPSIDLIQFTLVIWMLWFISRITPKSSIERGEDFIHAFSDLHDTAEIYTYCPTIINDNKFNECLRTSPLKDPLEIFDVCYNRHIFKKKCARPFSHDFKNR